MLLLPRVCARALFVWFMRFYPVSNCCFPDETRQEEEEEERKKEIQQKNPLVAQRGWAKPNTWPMMNDDDDTIGLSHSRTKRCAAVNNNCVPLARTIGTVVSSRERKREREREKGGWYIVDFGFVISAAGSSVLVRIFSCFHPLLHRLCFLSAIRPCRVSHFIYCSTIKERDLVSWPMFGLRPRPPLCN